MLLILLFVWGINAKFEETEELASKNSLHGTTRDKNIFKEVEKTKTKTRIHYNLKWTLLRYSASDGGKNICGAGKGLDKFTKPIKM